MPQEGHYCCLLVGFSFPSLEVFSEGEKQKKKCPPQFGVLNEEDTQV